MDPYHITTTESRPMSKVSNPMKEPKSTLKDALIDIGSRSTVHGISNIVTAPSIYRRLLWIAAFLACLGLVIYQLINIFVLYTSYETKTTYSLEFNTEFPAITICNNGYAAFDANVVHSVEHMLARCQYSRLNETCETPSSYWSNKYGVCFTISPPDHLSKFSGLQGAISLILNLETHRQAFHIQHGMRITVHNKDVFPFPFEDGLTMAAGDEIFIGIRKRKTVRLGNEYGECLSDQTLYGKAYTLKACQLICWERFLSDECNCRDPEIDSILSRVDTISQTKCYVPYYTDPPECFRKVREMFITESNCSCHLPCSETTYTMDASRHNWLRGPDAGSLADDICKEIYNVSSSSCQLDISGMNFVKVNLYLQDVTHETIIEEPLYERSQMLADIGGSLGLFIGASVLSIGEIIEALYMCLHVLCSRRKEGRETNAQ